jgi:ubiquinone/menaquinone biosynthesis C-methylase UbiE
MKELSIEELQELAKQLGCPEGAGGIRTADFMNVNNAGMIRRAMEVLSVYEGDRVLEIGPGNGGHVTNLVGSLDKIHYMGVDISSTMIEEATKMNEELVKAGKVAFRLSDGKSLPFDDDEFTRILTVNTLYFWENPAAYAGEIRRVLKPGGVFVLAISEKNFMEKLPFTQYGFQLYHKHDAEQLLVDAGFSIEKSILEIDVVTGSNLEQPIEREIVLIVAQK